MAKKKATVKKAPKTVGEALDLYADDEDEVEETKPKKRKSRAKKSTETTDEATLEQYEKRNTELEEENADLRGALTDLTQDLNAKNEQVKKLNEEYKDLKTQYNEALSGVAQFEPIISKIEKKQNIKGKGTYKFMGGNRKQFPVADKLAFAMIEFSKAVGNVFEDSVDVELIPDYIHFEMVNFLMMDEIDLLKQTLEKVSSEYEKEDEDDE